MAIKYFKIRNLETVLVVDDTKTVGQGKNKTSLVEQYEKRPDYYIPCDAKGNPLESEKPKAEAKAEVKEEPKAEAKAEAKADKKAEKAEKE